VIDQSPRPREFPSINHALTQMHAKGSARPPPSVPTPARSPLGPRSAPAQPPRSRPIYSRRPLIAPPFFPFDKRSTRALKNCRSQGDEEDDTHETTSAVATAVVHTEKGDRGGGCFANVCRRSLKNVKRPRGSSSAGGERGPSRNRVFG
jgi:hypothetical protein